MGTYATLLELLSPRWAKGPILPLNESANLEKSKNKSLELMYRSRKAEKWAVYSRYTLIYNQCIQKRDWFKGQSL
uniref:Uncharacterized protein n=1 Tax=Solanum tuberosum TaxID=4113 RepID=M1BZA3_SOLTU